MSLKTIHIIFITCSTLLAFGFGVWCWQQGSLSYRVGAGGSFFGGILLLVYGKWFLKKLKHVGYM